MKLEDIKNNYCKESFIEERLKKGEEEQKAALFKREAIHLHLKSCYYYYLSKFFEDCIYPIKEQGGTKEDFESYLCKAENLLNEAEDYLSSDRAISPLPENSFPYFEAGEDGDLYGLWEEQYHFDGSHLTKSLIQLFDYYLYSFKKKLEAIRNGILNGFLDSDHTFFFEHGPFSMVLHSKDFEVLCLKLKETYLLAFDERQQNIVKQI